VLVFDMRETFPVPSALDAVRGLALDMVCPIIAT